MSELEKIYDEIENLSPHELWARCLSVAASGYFLHLTKEAGLTEAQAKNRIIGDFLACASGEACRLARKEGRVPDPNKWRKATNDAFKRAVERTRENG